MEFIIMAIIAALFMVSFNKIATQRPTTFVRENRMAKHTFDKTVGNGFKRNNLTKEHCGYETTKKALNKGGLKVFGWIILAIVLLGTGQVWLVAVGSYLYFKVYLPIKNGER